MARPCAGALAILLLAVAAGVAGCGGGSAPEAAPQGTPSAAERSTGGGGERSIEDFGSEAEGDARTAVLAAFHGYLDAVGREDFAAACARLSARVKRSLERLVGGSKQQPCAVSLHAVLSPAAAALARRQAAGKIVGVRAQGSRGFVVFHAPGATLYHLPVVEEDGVWKAGVATAAVLVPAHSGAGG